MANASPAGRSGRRAPRAVFVVRHWQRQHARGRWLAVGKSGRPAVLRRRSSKTARAEQPRPSTFQRLLSPQTVRSGSSVRPACFGWPGRYRDADSPTPARRGFYFCRPAGRRVPSVCADRKSRSQVSKHSWQSSGNRKQLEASVLSHVSTAVIANCIALGPLHGATTLQTIIFQFPYCLYSVIVDLRMDESKNPAWWQSLVPLSAERNNRHDYPRIHRFKRK